jgi:hypothetical protein
MCKHKRRRYRCKDCPPEDRVGRCEHNRIFADCRLCNDKHPFHGVTTYHGRGSDFEDLVLRALISEAPPGTKIVEQFPVARPDSKHPFRIDLYMRYADGHKVCFEADGADHYEMAKKKRMSSPEEQMCRDRYKERFCLYNGISMIRIPYTMIRKMEQVLRYTRQATQRDREDGISKIHYIDFERSYAKINEFVEEGDGNEALMVHRCDENPMVYISDETSLDHVNEALMVHRCDENQLLWTM